MGVHAVRKQPRAWLMLHALASSNIYMRARLVAECLSAHGNIFNVFGGKAKDFNIKEKLKILDDIVSDSDHREFVSAGVSAGISAAFGAPIGGVLFAMEEACSFWNRKTAWRCFLAAILSTFTIQLLNRRCAALRRAAACMHMHTCSHARAVRCALAVQRWGGLGRGGVGPRSDLGQSSQSIPSRRCACRRGQPQQAHGNRGLSCGCYRHAPAVCHGKAMPQCH